MVLPLLMAAAGTGMSLYGAQKKMKALRGAEDAYAARVRQLMADRANMNADAQQGFGQLSDQHNAGLGTAVKGYLGAEDQAAPDPNYAPNAIASVNQLRQAAPDQGAWEATNGAATSAQADQSSHASARLNSLITSGQGQDRMRRLGVLRQNALQPYTTGEMQRGSQLQRLQQALALRQQTINSGFGDDQMRLQGDLNAAGRAGDHGIMWGTMLQQLGGGLMGQGGYGPGQDQAQAPQGDPGTSAYNLDNGGWAGYDYPQGGTYA